MAGPDLMLKSVSREIKPPETAWVFSIAVIIIAHPAPSIFLVVHPEPAVTPSDWIHENSTRYLQVTGMNNQQQNPAERFADLLEAHRGERHAIVLQDYPDPDAIACALAHRLIAEKYDIECDILYSGKISHPQNLAMVRLLDLKLDPYTDDMDLSGYQGSVFVDNQGTTSEMLVNALQKQSVPVVAVVDHHEPQDLLSSEFTDIRETGSASTIYCGYLEGGLVKLEQSQPAHVTVATALMLGLVTDTDNLIKATSEDFAAARFISQFSDQELLQKVLAQARPRYTMEAIHKALEDRVLVEGFSIAGIGYLRAEDRDAIPQAADFLMTEENVHTALVYGIVRGENNQESLMGSMRTTKLTISPDKFLKESLGSDEEGQPYGGGKKGAGGFEVPLGFLSGGEGEAFEEMKWKVYDARMKDRLLRHIGADPEES